MAYFINNVAFDTKSCVPISKLMLGYRDWRESGTWNLNDLEAVCRIASEDRRMQVMLERNQIVVKGIPFVGVVASARPSVLTGR